MDLQGSRKNDTLDQSERDSKESSRKVDREEGRGKEWAGKEVREIIFSEQPVFFRMIQRKI